VEPFEISGGKHRFRAKHIERAQTGKPREEIQIGGPVAIRFGEPIGDGQDQALQRTGRCFVDQSSPENVLVAASQRVDAVLVCAKRRREELRLIEQLRGAAIGVALGFELGAEVALEVVDPPAEAPNLIVQRQHFGDQAGPQLKRRRQPVFSAGAGRRGDDHLPFERRQHGGHDREPRRELGVELLARGDDRPGQGCPGRAERAIFNRAPQLLGRGTRRHDEARRARGRERE
jgi:hypothetical protein